jgi:hypothetical protein
MHCQHTIVRHHMQSNWPSKVPPMYGPHEVQCTIHFTFQSRMHDIKSSTSYQHLTSRSPPFVTFNESVNFTERRQCRQRSTSYRHLTSLLVKLTWICNLYRDLSDHVIYRKMSNICSNVGRMTSVKYKLSALDIPFVTFNECQKFLQFTEICPSYPPKLDGWHPSGTSYQNMTSLL